MRNASVCVLTAAIGVSLTITAGAQGAEPPTVELRGSPPQVSASLKVAGSHDYKIEVEGESDFVRLIARRKPSLATYGTVGTVTKEKIRVNYGTRGKVAARFTQTRPTRIKPGCLPDSEIKIKPGIWKGTIRFRGEKGYTKVNETRARGSVAIGNFTCVRTLPRQGPSDKVTLLASTNGSAREFQATKRQDGTGKVTFFARRAEQAPGPDSTILISREVELRSNPSRFTYTLPDQAHVKPPGPFRGQATLDGSDWSGNLRVKFPGGRSSLVGPAFSAFVFEGIPV